MAAAALSRRVLGVVFDMDGTLTLQGAIDFVRMRERVGAPRGTDVLEHIASQPDAAVRAALEAAVVEEEDAGLARMALAPDARAALARLAAAGVPTALLTRNNDAAVARTLALLALPAPAFSVALSRSFTPCKPHPAPLLHISAAWGVPAAALAMVGDSVDDMACARAAGAVALLVGRDGEACAVFREARPHADAAVASLTAVVDLVLGGAAAPGPAG